MRAKGLEEAVQHRKRKKCAKRTLRCTAIPFVSTQAYIFDMSEGLRSQHNNRYRVTRLAQSLDQVQTRHTRQTKVNHRQGVIDLLGLEQAIFPTPWTEDILREGNKVEMMKKEE